MDTIGLDTTCGTDGHEQVPAVAVLIYHGQGPILGEALCRACATCCVPGCERLGDVRDSDYAEVYCRPHADAFPADETPVGAEVVERGSERHRELAGQIRR